MAKPTDILGKLLDMFYEMTQRIGARRERQLEERRSEERARTRTRRGSRLMQQLKRGELTLDAYLNRKADLAVAPLRDLLDDDDLRFLRALARERLEDDPILTRLVARIRQSLTGQQPSRTR